MGRRQVRPGAWVLPLVLLSIFVAGCEGRDEATFTALSSAGSTVARAELRPVSLPATGAPLFSGMPLGFVTPAGHGGGSVQTPMDTECAACHDVAAEAVGRTPHAALDRSSAAHWGVETSCAACHRDASAHADSLGEEPVFAFGGTPSENAAVCSACHGDAHPRFDRSEHALAGLDCGSCHVSHPAAEAAVVDAFDPLAGRPSAVCRDCHEATLTEFRFTAHHRLEEGTLECTSCHDPHAPAERLQLGGFGESTCVECHRSQEGPFVFEHGGQLVEDCTACHAPHGSPNRHLLAFQQVAELCYSCHAFVPGFHTRFTVETQCTNCHATIHGSNLDAAFLK